jgi:ribosome biogenesis GTPase A
MASFWKHVKRVIDESDILIEVLDARFIQASRNIELEEKINRSKKQLLYVINKSDLVNPALLGDVKRSLKPAVFISSKDKLGTTILKKKILQISHGKEVTVGVVGYPNVGKSSLINALSGRGAARTSAKSGFTLGSQKIKVDNKIMILDTPGVFPYKEKEEFRLGKIGAIDADQLKDPESVALQLLEEEKKSFQNHYQLTKNDPEEMLEEIAMKLGKLLKGGKPNLELASRALLKDWQRGKIDLVANFEYWAKNKKKD